MTRGYTHSIRASLAWLTQNLCAVSRLAPEDCFMAPAVTPPSPPEQGQLVSVRSRQWIVNDVRPSTLPPPALKPAFSGPATPAHALLR